MSTHMVANELMAWRRLVLRYQHESRSHNRDSHDDVPTRLRLPLWTYLTSGFLILI